MLTRKHALNRPESLVVLLLRINIPIARLRRVGKCSVLAFVMTLLAHQQARALETVPVWTYYFSPPFITAYQRGLSYDFIDLLNQFAKGQYRFEIEPLPRTRINRNLEDKLPGIVLFVNWEWMQDSDKTKYLWSDPILSDRNEIISRRHGTPPIKIEFNGAESLKGMVFGGLTGRQYKGLEKAFERGDIIRRNVRNEEQNLALLLRDRIDVTSSAATVIRYKIKVTGLQNLVYFSAQPHFSYTRHLLITPQLAKLEPLLNEFIISLDQNPSWQSIKSRYAVE